MVRKFCPLPVLRKDFMIDPYQIYESQALGADCILLIVAALEDSVLHDLAALAKQLGMDVLIEVHNQPELERALRVETPLIGINNRDLHTFTTSLTTSIALQSQVPADRLLITESGVHTIEDVKTMHAHGIHAFLIGEAFMRADSPGQKLRELFTH
jgi:indole-3-glycerol phosphate synthase